MTAAAALGDALRAVAATERLLVCCDYDGTLAPLVADPAAARPQPGAIEAVVALAALPATDVVLLSGRARDALATLTGSPDEVRLVGSHGIETESPLVLEAAEEAHLAGLLTAAEGAVAGVPGARIEPKPVGVAVHAREVAEGRQAEVLAAARAIAAADPSLHVTPGKLVVELSVRATGKGAAVQRMRTELGATAVLFLGDDVTDEAVFPVLGPGDVGVKVGPGPSAAAHRVADPEAVVALLRDVRRMRLGVGGG